MTPVSDPASPRAPGATGARYLFVSDVHLDAAGPRGAAAIPGLPAHTGRGRPRALHPRRSVRELGRRRRCQWRSSRRAAALRQLTATGVACFLLHGNRDFLIGEDFCRADRLPAVARSGDCRCRWRAGVADARRCSLHRRPCLSGAAQHRQGAGLATPVPQPAALRPATACRRSTRRKPCAYRAHHPKNHGRQRRGGGCGIQGCRACAGSFTAIRTDPPCTTRW